MLGAARRSPPPARRAPGRPSAAPAFFGVVLCLLAAAAASAVSAPGELRSCLLGPGPCALEADIELPAGWEPVPLFSGELDGRGHTITVSTFADAEKLGVIGRAGASSRVSNLVVSGAPSLSTAAGAVGLLVGVSEGVLENVVFSGRVNLTSRAAGPELHAGCLAGRAASLRNVSVDCRLDVVSPVPAWVGCLAGAVGTDAASSRFSLSDFNVSCNGLVQAPEAIVGGAIGAIYTADVSAGNTHVSVVYSAQGQASAASYAGCVVGYAKNSAFRALRGYCPHLLAGTTGLVYAGGFFGGLEQSTVAVAFFMGTMLHVRAGGSAALGGFVGRLQGGSSSLSFCYASATTLFAEFQGSTAQLTAAAGGFLGMAEGVGRGAVSTAFAVVENCTVSDSGGSSTDYVGGFAGDVACGSSCDDVITGAFSSVSAMHMATTRGVSVGGFVGRMSAGAAPAGSSVSTCWAHLEATQFSSQPERSWAVGGFAGTLASSVAVESCYCSGSVAYPNAVSGSSSGLFAGGGSGAVLGCVAVVEPLNAPQTPAFAASGAVSGSYACDRWSLGQVPGAGVTTLSGAQIAEPSSYALDFANVWAISASGSSPFAEAPVLRALPARSPDGYFNYVAWDPTGQTPSAWPLDDWALPSSLRACPQLRALPPCPHVRYEGDSVCIECMGSLFGPCTRCSGGTAPAEDGQVCASCPDGFSSSNDGCLMQCDPVTQPNCFFCFGPRYCATCVSGTIPRSDGNPLEWDCIPQADCPVSSTHVLEDGRCVPRSCDGLPDIYAARCMLCTPLVCTECTTGYIASLIDVNMMGYCIPQELCNPDEGYDLDSSINNMCYIRSCSSLSPSVPNCERCSADRCLACSSPYYIDHRASAAVPMCVDACPRALAKEEVAFDSFLACVDRECAAIVGCLECAEDEALCASCGTGYTLSPGGVTCVSQGECRIPDSGHFVENCAACLEGERTLCGECAPGYGLAQSRTGCVKCLVENCALCEASAPALCTLCATGILDLRSGGAGGSGSAGAAACISEEECEASEGYLVDASAAPACLPRDCGDEALYGPGCSNCTALTCVRCGAPYVLDLRPTMETHNKCVASCPPELSKEVPDPDGGSQCVSKACTAISGCTACQADEALCARCGTVAAQPDGRCALPNACLVAPAYIVPGCATCDELDPAKCVACADGLVPSPDGYACASCPEGFVPNKDGTACIERNCLAGEKPVAACTRCREDDVTLCAACSGDSVPSGSGTVCEACAAGTVPNAEHTACVAASNACLVGAAAVPHCASCDPDVPTTCRQCAAGYEVSSGACIELSCTSGSAAIPGCVSCNQQDHTLCAACQESHRPSLSLDSCVEACLATFNCLACEAGRPEVCASCKAGYVPSPDGSACLEACLSLPGCLSCALDSPAVCALCEGGTYLASGACRGCPPQCATCSSQSYCLACAAGYHRAPSGACEAACPAGTFPSPGAQESTCVYCDADHRCVSCESASRCAACTAPYAPDGEGKCLGCAAGMYASSRGCLSCLESCATCDGPNSCLTCPSGAFLNTHSGVCQADCSRPGYWQGSAAVGPVSQPTCELCDPSLLCAVCRDASSCRECLPGQTLSGGRCESCSGPDCSCPDGTVAAAGGCQPCGPRCVRCEAAGACLQCEPGLVVGAAGECLDSCPPGFYVAEGRCESCDPSGACAACASASVCGECLAGYALREGSCLDCAPGYFREAGLCEACPLGCAACAEGRCLECFSPRLLRTDTGACVTSCLLPGYFADRAAGTCAPCDPSGACTACRDASTCAACVGAFALLGGSCAACRDGFRLEAGACEPCPALCRRCDTSSRYCDVCQEGTLLNTSDRTCVHACYGSGYFSGQATATLYDPDRQAMVQGVHSICSLCDTSGNCDVCAAAGACQTCVPGYRPVGGSCTECALGYVEDAGGCAPCGEGCLVCAADPGRPCALCRDDRILADGACTACAPAHYVWEGSCAPCNTGRLQHCAVCAMDSSAELVCSSCQRGYAGPLHFCVDVDPQCTASLVPVSFRAHCSLLAVSSCGACASGYYYQNGSCLSRCGSQPCLSCSSSGAECRECPSGYMLSGGHCSPCTVPGCGVCMGTASNCVSCRTGYLFAGKCEACPGEGCLACADSGGYCLTCMPGYRPYTAPNSGGQLLCAACVAPGCATCPDDVAVCTGCASGYGLVAGLCQRCAVENCVSCNGDPGVCSACSPGFYIRKSVADGAISADGSACLPCAAGCSSCSYVASCSDEGVSALELLCTECSQELVLANRGANFYRGREGVGYWACGDTQVIRKGITIALSSTLATVVAFSVGLTAILLYYRKKRGVWRADLQRLAVAENSVVVLCLSGRVIILDPSSPEVANYQGTRYETFYPTGALKFGLLRALGGESLPGTARMSSRVSTRQSVRVSSRVSSRASPCPSASVPAHSPSRSPSPGSPLRSVRAGTPRARSPLATARVVAPGAQSPPGYGDSSILDSRDASSFGPSASSGLASGLPRPRKTRPGRAKAGAAGGPVTPWRLLRLFNADASASTGRARGWAARSKLGATEARPPGAPVGGAGAGSGPPPVMSPAEVRARLALHAEAAAQREREEFEEEIGGGDGVVCVQISPDPFVSAGGGAGAGLSGAGPAIPNRGPVGDFRWSRQVPSLPRNSSFLDDSAPPPADHGQGFLPQARSPLARAVRRSSSVPQRRSFDHAGGEVLSALQQAGVARELATPSETDDDSYADGKAGGALTHVQSEMSFSAHRAGAAPGAPRAGEGLDDPNPPSSGPADDISVIEAQARESPRSTEGSSRNATPATLFADRRLPAVGRPGARQPAEESVLDTSASSDPAEYSPGAMHRAGSKSFFGDAATSLVGQQADRPADAGASRDRPGDSTRSKALSRGPGAGGGRPQAQESGTANSAAGSSEQVSQLSQSLFETPSKGPPGAGLPRPPASTLATG